MKNKAFTLIEFIVVCMILAVTGLMIFSFGYAVTHGDNPEVMAYINPRAAQAIALQQQAYANAELARQMAEQNRILREQIEKNKN